MKIGKNITDRRTAGLSSPRDNKSVEKFKEQKSRQVTGEKEERLVSRMPDEKTPTDDTLANAREQLYHEKNLMQKVKR